MIIKVILWRYIKYNPMEVHCHLPDKIRNTSLSFTFRNAIKRLHIPWASLHRICLLSMSYECLVLCFQQLTSTLWFIVAYILRFQTILFSFVVLLNTRFFLNVNFRAFPGFSDVICPLPMRHYLIGYERCFRVFARCLSVKQHTSLLAS